MGFFSDFFGGKDKSAQKKTIKDNAARSDFIRDMQAQSRSDLLALTPGAEQNLNLGFQSALDVYGQTVPQMMDVFQQGNVGAQQMLASGLPQVHNAILGMPVDYSYLQPQTLNYDASFAQQQLPDYVSVSDLLGGQNIPQQAPQGMGRGGGRGGFSSGFNQGFDPAFWGQANNVVTPR